MRNRFPPPNQALAIPLIASLLLTMMGCGKEEAAVNAPTTKAAEHAPAEMPYTYDGIAFKYPVEWKLTPLDDIQSLEIVAPRDGDWEPDFVMQIRNNPDGKSIGQILAESLQQLSERPGFESRGSAFPIDLPAGGQYGRNEYNSITKPDDKDAAPIALTQWSVAIALGEKKWLHIQARASAATWDKYKPKFQKIIDSLQPPK